MTSGGRRGSPQSRKWMRSVPLRKKRSLNSGIGRGTLAARPSPRNTVRAAGPAETIERDGARGDQVERIDFRHHGDPEPDAGDRQRLWAQAVTLGAEEERRPAGQGAGVGDVLAVVRRERDQLESRCPQLVERRSPV